MPSPRAHRGQAARSGRAAAQRNLVGSEQSTFHSPLDTLLEALGVRLRKENYKINHCAWCANRVGLRTGYLPQVGAILFCPAHEEAYRYYRGEDPPAKAARDDHEVHWPDAFGPVCNTAMDVAPRLATHPAEVTCAKCRRKLAKKGR